MKKTKIHIALRFDAYGGNRFVVLPESGCSARQFSAALEFARGLNAMRDAAKVAGFLRGLAYPASPTGRLNAGQPNQQYLPGTPSDILDHFCERGGKL